MNASASPPPSPEGDGGPPVLYRVANGIATITLNRPRRLNAVDRDTALLFDHICREAAADPEARVVVLTGAGTSFCAGADLRATTDVAAANNNTPAANLQRSGHLGWCAYNLFQIDKPAIAAIQGNAVGGGLGLALACDIRIAAEDARFSAMFTKRALTPDSGVSLLLPSAVRYPKAAEMILTSRFVDAREALKMGLVNRVVPAGSLEDAAYGMARLIAESAPVAVRLSKRALRRPLDREAAAAFEYESYGGLVTAKTEDRAEGRHAFLEKRPPRWTGR